MKSIKVYMAGNIIEKGEDDHGWRDKIAKELGTKSGLEITSSDI